VTAKCSGRISSLSSLREKESEGLVGMPAGGDYKMQAASIYTVVTVTPRGCRLWILLSPTSHHRPDVENTSTGADESKCRKGINKRSGRWDLEELRLRRALEESLCPSCARRLQVPLGYHWIELLHLEICLLVSTPNLGLNWQGNSVICGTNRLNLR
jgi:hypothetical protein